MRLPGTDPHSARLSVVQWIIAGLLAVIAAGLWLPRGDTWVAAALAQGAAGPRGSSDVIAVCGPITRDEHGIYMVDVGQGTLWCYAIERAGGAPKLRLVAARSWLYDRYLQDFNGAPPSFRDVQALVSQQRARPDAPEPPATPRGEPPP